MLSENGRKDSLRFTAALANGHDLYAFRYAVNDAANTLYFRASGNGVVVVSEPLDEDHASWKAVPENAVLVAEAGKKVEIFSLDEKRLQAAE
jgi:glutamine amidotransferase